jgi:hypothetical protein
LLTTNPVLDPDPTSLKSHGPDEIWIHNTKKPTSDFLPLSNLLQLILKASQPLLRSYSKNMSRSTKNHIKNMYAKFYLNFLTAWPKKGPKTAYDLKSIYPLEIILKSIFFCKSLLVLGYSQSQVCLRHVPFSDFFGFFFVRDDLISIKESCTRW